MFAYHTTIEFNNKTYNAYLPSIGQLFFLFKNIKELNPLLNKIGGNTLLDSDWWSSTEGTEKTVWFYQNIGEEITFDNDAYINSKNGDSYSILPLFKLK